jgi:raffinose/stachyose/melibiose transport system substrate-binding protein
MRRHRFVVRKGRIIVSRSTNLTFNRRKLLGTAGAGAVTILDGLGGSAAPMPTRFAAPYVHRGQEATTLTFWHLSPEQLEPFNRVMADFTATNPGIEVVVEMTPRDQYQAKLQTALNSGTGPDIFGTQARPQLDIDAKTGLILDITDLVDQSQMVPLARDAVTVDGKEWAVASGAYTVGICYHRDMFEEAGIEAEPATWAEFRAVMDQLLAAGMTPYSIAVKDGSLTYFNYIGLASSILGLDGFNAVVDGKRKLNDPDVVAAIEEMRAWIPYYQTNYLGTVYEESKALFASKRTAMMDCGSGDLSGYYEIDPDIQLGFFYWPAPDETKSQVTNTGLAVGFGINAASTKVDAAVTFLQWLASPEGSRSMMLNTQLLPLVEGVEPEGDPILTEMINTPMDIPVWYERWATLKIGEVWTVDGVSAFDENTTPQSFADKLQASVDEQLATPLGG